MSNKEFNRLPEIIPEDIANNSAEFVRFLKKYYEFMNQEDMPSHILNNSVLKRDVLESVGLYLDNLYQELGYGYYLNTDSNRQNILANLSDIYAAKGSVDSVKALFRILFGEEVNITFPKELILQPSSGNWLSQYSVMMVLNEGNANDIIGKFVEVETQFPNSPLQTFDVEIKRVELRDAELDIYEVYTSRYFSGFFYNGSVINYNSVKMTQIPTMSKLLSIDDGGTGFRVGETFVVNDYNRNSSFNNTIDFPGKYKYKVPSWRGGRTKYGTQIVETVDTDVRADGTITKVIEYTKGTGWSKQQVRRTEVIRGTKKTTRYEYDNGTETEVTETVPGITSPNLQVNWDAIAAALVEIQEFELPNPLTFYSHAQSIDAYGKQYADITGDGRISASDALIVLKVAVGIYEESDYGRITAWLDEWESISGTRPAVNLSLAIDLLRICVGLSDADPEVQQIQALVDWIQEAAGATDYVRGDIDNDGYIDTDDLLAIVKWTDPTLQSELTTDQLNWINTYIADFTTEFPLLDNDDLILAFGATYSASKRNELHDFLLEIDGDYNTGHVRADIDQDNIITSEDVKLLLRRAAGAEITDEQLTWIDETIAEPLLGSIYNPALEDGPGTGALARVAEVDGSGAITKLKIVQFGYNYPDYFATYVAPTDPAGTPASLTFANTIIGITSPTYTDRKGFLSDIIKVQDNDYYQQFSYVVETGVDFDQFSDILRKSVNPAGMKFFGLQTITDEFEVESEQDDSLSFYFNRLFYELTDHMDANAKHIHKPREDEAQTTDDTTNDIHKPKFDEAIHSDDDVYHLEKPRFDELGAEHNKEVYLLHKPKYDSADAEHNKETLDIHKPKYDNADAEESNVYSMQKPLSNIVGNIHNVKEVYEITKPRFDFFSADETEVKTFGKGLEDVATTSELILSFQHNKVYIDNAVTSHNLDYSFHKVLFDGVTISDQQLVSLGLNFIGDRGDETAGATDAILSKITGLVESDNAVMSDITTPQDSDIYSINKVISDQVHMTDTGDIDVYMQSPYAEPGYFVDDFDYAETVTTRST